jgi:Tol biopolymer transport system component
METNRCHHGLASVVGRVLWRVVGATLAASLFLTGAAAQGTTAPAGLGCDGQPARWVHNLSLSADGQLLAFESPSTDLVPGDTNNAPDIFVQDRASGRTTRVSVSSSGAQSHGLATWPSLSADGCYVAFMSDAPDLVPGDTNGRMDVFIHDRRSGRTRLGSVSSLGLQPDHHSMRPSLSGDGRLVAFESLATNLVVGDTNGAQDVFVHDLLTGATWRVSVGPGGLQADGNSFSPCLSADGTKVAFTSAANNLVGGVTSTTFDVFVHDLQTGTTVRATLGLGGSEPDDSSASAVLSGDGRLVAFGSRASNLVPGDTNNSTDIFVVDLRAGWTRRVSVGRGGAEAHGDSEYPAISADGRTVAFCSRASDLVPGDTNGWADVFVHDLASGSTTRGSVSTAGAEGDGFCVRSSLSADGRLLAFTSLATDLVPGRRKPYVERAYLRDRDGCSPAIGGYCHGSRTSLPGCVAALAGDGAPSLSAPSGFRLRAGPMPGGGHGVLAWSPAGPAAVPIGSQGGVLCLAVPSWRTSAVASGGTPGSCSGMLELTLADLLAVVPPLQPSATVWVQAWFRDAQAPDGYGLSSALWFQVCP